jgi:hypothetical protein
MNAECNVVYRENIGGSLQEESDRVSVTVKEWHCTVSEFTITVAVRTRSVSTIRKELVDGDLAMAVRRGIQIFDEELAKHPVLGKAHD